MLCPRSIHGGGHKHPLFLEWSNQKFRMYAAGSPPVKTAIPPFVDLPYHTRAPQAPLLHTFCRTTHEAPWSSISFPTTRSIRRSYPLTVSSATGSVLVGPYRRFGRVAPSSSDLRLTTTTRLSGKSPGAGSAGTRLSTAIFSRGVLMLRAGRRSR